MSFTILCLASYFKGGAFLQEVKRQGGRALLLTAEKNTNEPWPMESIDERFLMPDLTRRQDVFNAVSYLARSRQIDRIIPLDDYDVETAAALREHMRLPGLGDTAVRYFRDKLAMRTRARESGVPVPDFVSIFNYDRIREFMARVPPPWVLKPRSEAGSMGIKKIEDGEQFWRQLDALGDRQSYFLLEQYVPGDVFHVDSITYRGEVLFAAAHRYARPLLNVTQEGGVFSTRTVPRDSADLAPLQALNRQVIAALGMQNGVTHAEYIKSGEGPWYFLEIAARVGGANIAEVVQYSTGLNLWAEWARLEIAQLRGEIYTLPEPRQDYAGVLICLARQESPDTSAYDEPEIVWRLNKRHHAGLIVASSDSTRVQTLLDSYIPRFASDFMAVMPPKDKPEA